MVQIIRLPALSPTMETGSVAKWHVAEGDAVESGDLLVDIETDKTSMEVEAVDSGIVGKILIEAGAEIVAVNTPIAVLLEDGEALPENLSTFINEEDSPPAAAEESAAHTEVAIEDTPPPPARHERPQQGSDTRIFATPLARRIAAQKNIDLKSIKGSGPHGRIVKSDVEEARGHQAPLAAAATPSDLLTQYEGREFTPIPLDGMRKTVAARLTEAKTTIPHFYLRRDMIIDSLLDLRHSINEVMAKQDIRISINDFVIKASALALQQVPAANAIWAGDQILQFKPSDVAVAVAIEGGLLTPIIRDAETKSLPQLSVEMKTLAARAKSRKLMPSEYTGGTFSISNLGMFGVENFDAVINPPHASILAVGASQRRAVENEDGSVGFATFMSMTLSCDHRVIDGAVAAQFLAAIAENIENPLLMLL